jgi:hypothetical protein
MCLHSIFGIVLVCFGGFHLWLICRFGFRHQGLGFRVKSTNLSSSAFTYGAYPRPTPSSHSRPKSALPGLASRSLDCVYVRMRKREARGGFLGGVEEHDGAPERKGGRVRALTNLPTVMECIKV